MSASAMISRGPTLTLIAMLRRFEFACVVDAAVTDAAIGVEFFPSAVVFVFV